MTGLYGETASMSDAAAAPDARASQRIAIAGMGAIGLEIANALNNGIAGCELTAVSARNLDKARAAVAGFRKQVAVVPIAQLEAHADIVVECAPAALLPSIAGPFLE